MVNKSSKSEYLLYRLWKFIFCGSAMLYVNFEYFTDGVNAVFFAFKCNFSKGGNDNGR